jgi:hypothetical protein
MTRLGDLFPALDEAPRAILEAGLDLDSDHEELPRPQDGDLLPRIFQGLVGAVAENESMRLVAQLPSLKALAGSLVAPAFDKSRSRNALARHGIRTWGDLGERTPGDLRSLPNVGALTVGDILRTTVETVVFGPPSSNAEEEHGGQEVSAQQQFAMQRLSRIVQLLASWASSERNLHRLGDVLTHQPGVGLPPDLHELWHELNDLALDDLRAHDLPDHPLDVLCEDLLAQLDDPQRTVVEERLLTVDPPTLEQVGKRMSVTRERVRQIQVRAEERLQSLLRSDRYRSISWRADDLREALGPLALADSEETVNAFRWCLRDVALEAQSLVTNLLLYVAGPYRRRDGWLELVGAPDLDVRELLGLADEGGMISLASAREWFSHRSVEPAFQDAWLDQTRKFRRFGEQLVVWNGSLVDKCVSVLALRGEPADAETLVREVGEGHNARGARDRFFGDERLMRVNRTQWALRSWGLEEYTGITDEIAQRVELAGGRVRLLDVVDEIASQFNVRPASVRVYAEAPMFVIEDAWVRLRRDDEPFPVQGSLTDCRGVYRSGDRRISVVVPVDKETLRGSGRGCPQPLADLLGVRPGVPRNWTWSGGELLVTWPPTAAYGPSIGSCRALALAAGAGDGDLLRLEFDLDAFAVTASRVPPEGTVAPVEELIRAHTGVDLGVGDDPVAAVARAVGVGPADVRRRLLERGDRELAAVLPVPAMDSSLEAALAELAEVFDET